MGPPQHHSAADGGRHVCRAVCRGRQRAAERQRGGWRRLPADVAGCGADPDGVPSACEHHNRIVRNLVSVLAQKLLRFNEKITHTGQRTTREKLLSYLSAEAMRRESLCFSIAFDRQQLADYLCVDRSAMSAELSRM